MLCVGLKPYARRAIGPGSCTEESLIEQKNVQRHDDVADRERERVQRPERQPCQYPER